MRRAIFPGVSCEKRREGHWDESIRIVGTSSSGPAETVTLRGRLHRFLAPTWRVEEEDSGLWVAPGSSLSRLEAKLGVVSYLCSSKCKN